jgi:hypothetical protein
MLVSDSVHDFQCERILLMLGGTFVSLIWRNFLSKLLPFPSHNYNDCTLIDKGWWEVGSGIFSPHLGWHIYELLVILGFWWSSSATKITFIYMISKNVHDSMPVYMCLIVVLSLHNKIGKFSWDWHVVEAIMISFLTLKHWCLIADCTNWICFINSVTES